HANIPWHTIDNAVIEPTPRELQPERGSEDLKRKKRCQDRVFVRQVDTRQGAVLELQPSVMAIQTAKSVGVGTACGVPASSASGSRPDFNLSKLVVVEANPALQTRVLFVRIFVTPGSVG